MHFAARQAISWTEQGLVPDRIIRGAIVRLLLSCKTLMEVVFLEAIAIRVRAAECAPDSMAKSIEQ